MTPQELKNSILQLAIQGKLVEQRPEEGTAEELFREIQKEKQALIKAGKIKKEKPLPEITEDEIPFEIPETWKWVRLGDCTSYAHTKEKVVSTEIEPESWSLDLEDIEKESGKIVNFCKAGNRKITGDKVIFHKGQILYSKLRPYLKKILVAPQDGICTPELVPFWTFGGLDAQYIVSVLKAPHVDFAINAVTYGVKMPRVGTETMVNLLVPLPPLAEQKRIVARIEELLPLIDRYEKAWIRLEDFNKRFPGDMQKSILQMAIQGKLVEQRSEEGTGEELYQQIQKEKQALIKAGKIKKEKPMPEITEDEIPFEIPETWKWVRLNTIFQFIDYRGKTPQKIQSGIRLIGSGNIKKRFLDFSKEDAYISEEEYMSRKSRGLTKFGDILFVTEGGSTGNAAINTWSGDCSCGQRVITFQSYEPRLLENKLFLNYILSEYFQHAVKDRRTGSAATGIKGDTLKQVLIPLPPLAEQKRIVARLEELLPLCEKLK